MTNSKHRNQPQKEKNTDDKKCMNRFKKHKEIEVERTSKNRQSNIDQTFSAWIGFGICKVTGCFYTPNPFTHNTNFSSSAFSGTNLVEEKGCS